MFDDGIETLEKILALVAKCPEVLQEKCFEILLHAYVNKTAVHENSRAPKEGGLSATPNGPAVEQANLITGVPEQIKPRLVAMAGRMKVSPGDFAALFDFQLDPFNFHALAVPGGTKAEKARNVALLLGAKAYLTTGQWTADWKESRAVCVDQNCFDANNYATHLKHTHIKTASAASGITLSGTGVTGAEALLRKLTGVTE